MKYKKQILLSIIFLSFLVFTVISSVSKFPIVLFVLLIPVMAIIGVLLGYILAPLFLLVYKKFFGRNMLFGIQDRPNPEKFAGTLRGIFPSLMATSIALSLIYRPELVNNPLLSSFYEDPNGIILLFFILCTVFITFTVAFFSAAWFIIDSGIIATNKKKVKNKRDPIEVKSIGGWYIAFLKGYAGIGAVIGIYTFFGQMAQLYGNEMHISIPLIFIPLPILLALWILPSIIILDKTYENRKRYILNFGKKIGIINEIEVNIKELEV
ncbi:MAG: hypothetical protein ACTSQJ_10750 [Promethearchaeota archaeon]